MQALRASAAVTLPCYQGRMARILVLPPGLVNQIAAGEVVERPASVAKELLENALDAGARQISVESEDGGLSLVRVADDGTGMEPEDARLALERHATSKLKDAEGLAAIATLGFRGEAIPAIASVSRFRLDTSSVEDGAGTRVVVEGGTLVEVAAAARPRGTTVEVRDLFFNTPARRKFMRSTSTESGHLAEAVIRVALGRPDVGFTLRSGGRTLLTARAGEGMSERAAHALGREAHRHLLPVDVRRGALRVHGVVCSPDHSEPTSRALYLLVNGRYVRDRGAAHAVLRAFAGTLPAGRHPAGVLFLEVPLSLVDVNVHPQKLEVRFADAREAYDAVFHAVASTLRTAPWLGRGPPSGAPQLAGGAPFRREEEALQAAEVLASARERAAPEGSGGRLPYRLSHPPWSSPSPTWRRRALRATSAGCATSASTRAPTSLCEAPGGALVIIDQHASHERLLFERLREAQRAGSSRCSRSCSRRWYRSRPPRRERWKRGSLSSRGWDRGGAVRRRQLRGEGGPVAARGGGPRGPSLGRGAGSSPTWSGTARWRRPFMGCSPPWPATPPCGRTRSSAPRRRGPCSTASTPSISRPAAPMAVRWSSSSRSRTSSGRWSEGERSGLKKGLAKGGSRRSG